VCLWVGCVAGRRHWVGYGPVAGRLGRRTQRGEGPLTRRKGPLRRMMQAIQSVASQAAELGVLLKYPDPEAIKCVCVGGGDPMLTLGPRSMATEGMRRVHSVFPFGRGRPNGNESSDAGPPNQPRQGLQPGHRWGGPPALHLMMII